MNLVEQYLDTAAGNAAVDGFRPVGSLVLTPRFPDSRHVVVLLLDRQRRVRVVGKIVRSAGDPSTLDQEADVLRALADRDSSGAGSAVNASVPRLLGLEWFGGHRLMLQTAVAGKPITHYDARRRTTHWWAVVEKWLDTLRIPAWEAAEAGATDRYLGERIDLARRVLLRSGGLAPEVDRAMTVTAAFAAELRCESPFTVVEHGDLSHPNLLWSGTSLAVVDWETGYRNGLVGIDAAVFLTFLELARAGAHGVEQEAKVYVDQMLDPAGAGRQRLAKHLRERGIRAELIDHVLLTAWGRIALGVFPRLLSGPRAGSAAESRTARLFTEGRPHRLWMLTLERALTASSPESLI